ncbi:DNA polymerase ligase N-terminal domain-containing protein, partial [Rhizobiaceae sp. 2RAB30]
MAGLEQYKSKRNFRITSEPSGRRGRAQTKSTALAFVVHKHDATRLHYDLRLEHGGVLWSWAVTRGPSLDPSEKRLAVHVEDHPLDYASFEGMIPQGQYGAGAVIVWDEGTWEPEGDPAAGMKKGHLRFTLKGEKLQGTWNLVRLRPRPGEKRDNWLLIKSRDDYASARGDVLEDEPRSVKSGRTIEEVAAGNAKAKAAPKKAVAKQRAPSKKQARPRALPDFVQPCLARLESTPPLGDEWLHEVKFDGYRIQAAIAGDAAKLRTRTGLDWTDRFGKAIPAALEKLDCDAALIDGEIVVLGENGVSVFSSLQLDLSEGRTSRMLFYAFDLLSLDGKDIRDEPL